MNFEAHKPAIAELAKKHNLDLVVLFGSQATGVVHAKSDIDIAILSHKSVDRNKLAIAFDEIFDRDDIELVNLANASPTLMHAIVRDGKSLYESHPDTFFKWKLYAMWVWRDTSWLRDLRDKKLIEWAKTV